jgi:transposase
MKLTDSQWAIVEPLLPKPEARADRRGRPRQDDRKILDGVLWILRTGAQWEELPRTFPPKSTCHDRFQEWTRNGAFAEVLKALAEDLRERGKLDLAECAIDATFTPAKKGGWPWAPPSGGRAAKSWQWQTLAVFLSPCTWRALPLTRRRWLQQHLRIGSLRHLRAACLATALSTVTPSIHSFGLRALR